jgi:hypothetical protein
VIRSQSKIRHLHNTNIILERRFLKESGIIDSDIYWQSCDGKLNKLTEDSKKLLKLNDGGEEIYTFTVIPEDKSENGEFTIKDCLGVYGSTDKFKLEDYNGVTVLRSLE